MHSIEYGNKKVPFKIKRSNRRKTVGIHIDPGKGVVVRAPHFLRDDEITDIVRKKARWIIDKQEVIKNQKHLVMSKEFVTGEAFSYLGRQFRLRVIKSDSEKNEKCKLINGRFVVTVGMLLRGATVKGTVRKALMDWYFEHAKKRIPERVNLYARQIGAWPQRIEIKNHKGRWGSCSRNGVVRLNWKIIMPPVTVLDYVIVHELCHLIYPHHSSRFWEKVETIIPDYKTRRNRLKEYSLQVAIFD